MSKSWFKITLPIALIFAFRMLGLFMLIPIFSIYGLELEGATPVLIGLALGAYGFSQGLMQMPFGILSDYFGRKSILSIGLICFALGSAWGAYTHSIYGMIGARTLQGFGAIGSVLIALLADLVEDKDRPKSMAIIGMSIGMSFAIAMIISPIIAGSYGLTGIFRLTILFALVGLVILYSFIPNTNHPKPSPFNKTLILESFLPPELLKCHLGIWCQHFILTSSFFAIPLILKQSQIPLPSFYLSLMLTSFIIMLPLIAWAERKNMREQLFSFTLFFLVIGQLALCIVPHQLHSLWAAMFVYFLGFNVLEALFPAMLARAANPSLKGTASGIYSSLQFLGIFFGGIMSGIIFKSFGGQGIFVTNCILACIYTLFIVRYKN